MTRAPLFAAGLAALALSPAHAQPPSAAPPAPLTAPPPGAAGPYPINIGYWEAKETFIGLIHKTEQWCIQPKDIDKVLSGPSNHIYRCIYPTHSATDGKMNFDGTCSDKEGHLKLKLHGVGDYSPTTLHFTAAGSGTYYGLPFSFSHAASVDGRFIAADCPAGVKKFKD